MSSRRRHSLSARTLASRSWRSEAEKASAADAAPTTIQVQRAIQLLRGRSGCPAGRSRGGTRDESSQDESRLKHLSSEHGSVSTTGPLYREARGQSARK